jgi:hypothetical protein
MPSRGSRKGAGRDALVAPMHSNPAATKTLTASYPPAMTTSATPSSSQRAPSPRAIADDAQAASTWTEATGAVTPRATSSAESGPKYGAARASGGGMGASRLRSDSASVSDNMPPDDVPTATPTFSVRQAGRRASS